MNSPLLRKYYLCADYDIDNEIVTLVGFDKDNKLPRLEYKLSLKETLCIQENKDFSLYGINIIHHPNHPQGKEFEFNVCLGKAQDFFYTPVVSKCFSEEQREHIYDHLKTIKAEMTNRLYEGYENDYCRNSNYYTY